MFSKKPYEELSSTGKWWRNHPGYRRKELEFRHSKEYREKSNSKQLMLYKRRRQEILDILGNECANPYNIDHGGFSSNISCLCIDHKNGGGQKELRICKGQTLAYYRHVLKEIKRIMLVNEYRKLTGSNPLEMPYQLLCANCNMIKARKDHEFGYGRRAYSN
jgi:hypothetical protein